MKRIEGDNHLANVLTELRNRAEVYFPGARFASVYSPTEKEMVLVPIAEALVSQFGHGVDYASGVFEGSSAMINERTGVPHVILLEQRNRRLFHRSLPARGYEAPVSEEAFALATLNLIVANGLDLFKNPNGEEGFVRAYIRPTMYPATLAGYGISMRKEYPVDAGIIAWAWPDYLDHTLATRGGVCAITGHQRLFKVTGKHASNYGAAVKDGGLARSREADELIYLAPYLIDKDGHLYWDDPNNLEAKLRDGVICDGPGEECVALTKDQKTLIYPPMTTNRLGGTVLQYIIDHMAKNVGLETREGEITLHDIRTGKYAGLAMVGNAVKVTPMRQINLQSPLGWEEKIRFFAENNVPEKLDELRVRWENETRGLVDPSHPSLLTSVEDFNLDVV